MPSLNDHENRIKNLEAQVNSNLVTIQELFGTGAVNSINLCSFFPASYQDADIVFTAGQSYTFNSSSKYKIYFANVGVQGIGGELHALSWAAAYGAQMPYGTYKALSTARTNSVVDGYTNSVPPIILMARTA